MQDPEEIKRFTQGAAMMKDPPWLPIALWMGLVPALVELGVLHPAWLFSFPVAAVATAVAVRWFKRTYGVVTPAPDSFPGRVKAGGGIAIIVVVFGLEALSNALRLPIRLGLVGFGAWLIWGARASRGVRSHLYVLGAICVGLAFIPLVGDNTLSMRGSIVLTAFGLGWAYVCIQDYRVLVRSLPHGHR